MNVRSFRYWSALAAVGALAIFIAARYAYLASQKGPGLPDGDSALERGLIYDREGRVLAMDSPVYDIAVWRPATDQEKFPAEARRLAEITGAKASETLEKWSKGSQDYFYLARRADPQVADEIKKEKADGAFAGVVVEKVSGRLYPEKRLASHLVGFVGDGNRGLAGIESRYDEELLPSKPPKGKAMGESLVLTIDADVQFSLEKIARAAKDSTGAEAVMLVAADARTGAVLAYVAMPDFDPNDYAASPAADWYDWPSVYHYEPGSVFKVFSMASVVDLGGASASSSFVCDGAYRKTTSSGEKITIKCLGYHGSVDIAEILALSCNAGAAYASDTVASVPFYEKLSSFGFGSRTGIALPSETPGTLASPEIWSGRTKPTIAMGQELFVSAMQMTQAGVAIANGGNLLKPYAVQSSIGPGGEILFEAQAQPVRRVVSAETSRMILAAMEKAASEEGTGRRASIDDVRMAVKTGTAQMIDPSTKSYSEKDYIASTLAIFPADSPRVVAYLAIVKPTQGPSYYGGRIAAPVMREVAEAMLSLTSLPRGSTPSVTAPRAVALPKIVPVEIGGTMPDLAGTPKRLVMPLLARKDIKVTLRGEGYVVGQSPAPGAAVKAGDEIILELR